jgi:thiol-disulfide isomerase/thioredoxin
MWHLRIINVLLLCLSPVTRGCFSKVDTPFAIRSFTTGNISKNMRHLRTYSLILLGILMASCSGNQGIESSLAQTNDSEEEVSLITPLVTEVIGESLPLYEDPLNDLAVGMSAPQAVGSDLLSGTEVAVTPSGKPLIVAFFAHWCPHCQREVAEMTEWLASNKFPNNVDLIAVSTFEDSSRGNYPPSEWLASHNWPFPVIADTSSVSVAEAYGAISVPFFVFINADGVVVKRTSGNIGPILLLQLIEDLTGTSI